MAMLEAQGITGLSIIELRDRGDKQPGFEVDTNTIPGLPSVFSQLSDSASSVAESAASALARINQLLSPQTVANLQQSAAHIAQLSRNLAQASNQLGELTSSVSRVSLELEKALPEYRAIAVRLNDELLPTMVTAGNSVQAASNAITGSLGENGEQVAHLMNKELPTLIGMTDELALVLQQLSETMENISDQPGSLLYGQRLQEVEISLD